MNILMVNKFLYPRGGAETYVLKLGKALEEQGHAVQYFGMDHPNRTVGTGREPIPPIWISTAGLC